MNTKQKVDLFIKRRDKVVELLKKLTDTVYQDDFNKKQMTGAVNLLAADILTSDEFTDELARKILGFYIWMNSRRRLPAENGSMLATMFHDIGGVIRRERFFLPRTEMYLEFYKDDVLDIDF